VHQGAQKLHAAAARLPPLQLSSLASILYIPIGCTMLLTGMLGSRLLGVYMAAKGITHFVASSLLLGHRFQVSRTPSVSSGWFQSGSSMAPVG
jgi:hypothetical protein